MTHLVELLGPRAGERILEVAAGPGETGFRVAPLLGSGGRLVSTDGAPEMVEAARRRSAELGLENVDHAVADAVALPFEDGSFDGALCRFGLMLVPDMDAAAHELARVVRPGGRVVVAVWADSELNPWMTAAGRSALELGLVDRPDPDAPGPFRLSAPGRLRALLTGAGLDVTDEDDVPVLWQADSLDEWWAIIRETSRALAQLTERVPAERLADVRAGAERRLSTFVGADGRVTVPSVARAALALRR